MEGVEPSCTIPSRWRLCHLPTSPWCPRFESNERLLGFSQALEPFQLRERGVWGGSRTHGVSYVTDLQSAAFAARHTQTGEALLRNREGSNPTPMRRRSASNRGGKPTSPYLFLGGERRSRTPSPCGLTRFRDGGRYQHRLHSPRRMAASVGYLNRTKMNCDTEIVQHEVARPLRQRQVAIAGG